MEKESVQGGSVDDIPLTGEEIEQFINASISAVYERAYNQAIDDILNAYENEGTLEDVIERIQGFRKCALSSLTRQ